MEPGYAVAGLLVGSIAWLTGVGDSFADAPDAGHDIRCFPRNGRRNRPALRFLHQSHTGMLGVALILSGRISERRLRPALASMLGLVGGKLFR